MKKPVITQMDETTNTSGKDVFGFFAGGGRKTNKFLSERAMSSREMRRKAERLARRNRKKGKP